MSEMAVKAGTLALTLFLAAGITTQALAATPGKKDAAEKPSSSAKADKGSKKIKGLKFAAEAGLGYDSNVYLTPDNAYVDFAPQTPVTVNPNKQSGWFIPLGVDAEYQKSLNNKTDIIAQYKFDGHFYESDKDNANLYDHRFTLGPEFKLGESGDKTLYGGILLGYHKEIYYDRDDGFQKTSGVTDISEKYSYDTAGVEVIYRQDINKFGLDLFGSFEKRDYEDPVVVSQYDHDYLNLGGTLSYKVSGPTTVSAGYKYSSRDYEERGARDLNGNLFASNPKLEYTYHTLEVGVRHRISDKLVGYLDYAWQKRKDEWVGYNDYTQNRYKVRAIYTPIEKLRLRLAASYWDREYDRAFAFDNPVAGKKDYDGVGFDASGEYSYTDSVKFWAEVNYDEQNTTDKRYEYERTQTMAGLRYEY